MCRRRGTNGFTGIVGELPWSGTFAQKLMESLNSGLGHGRMDLVMLTSGLQQSGILADKVAPSLGVKVVGNDIAQLSIFLHAVEIFALHDGRHRN